MDNEAVLKRHLWDYFVIAQYQLLPFPSDERTQFADFVAGKVPTPPFTKGSSAWIVCELCGKL